MQPLGAGRLCCHASTSCGYMHTYIWLFTQLRVVLQRLHAPVGPYYTRTLCNVNLSNDGQDLPSVCARVCYACPYPREHIDLCTDTRNTACRNTNTYTHTHSNSSIAFVSHQHNPRDAWRQSRQWSQMIVLDDCAQQR